MLLLHHLTMEKERTFLRVMFHLHSLHAECHCAEIHLTHNGIFDSPDCLLLEFHKEMQLLGAFLSLLSWSSAAWTLFFWLSF